MSSPSGQPVSEALPPWAQAMLPHLSIGQTPAKEFRPRGWVPDARKADLPKCRVCKRPIVLCETVAVSGRLDSKDRRWVALDSEGRLHACRPATKRAAK